MATLKKAQDLFSFGENGQKNIEMCSCTFRCLDVNCSYGILCMYIGV